MNVANLCRDLLTYLDVRSLPEVIDSTYKQTIFTAINGAAQEVYSTAAYTAKQPRGGVFRTPVTVNLTGLTQFGVLATLASPISWIGGCTIIISTESTPNQIASISGNTITLARPYLSTIGNATATIFADCVTLPADVTLVSPQSVFLATGPGLHMATGLDDLLGASFRNAQTDYGRKFSPAAYRSRPTGTPTAYFVDTFVSQTVSAKRLRVNPMPDREIGFTYEAMIRPPKVMEHPGSGSPDPGIIWVSFAQSPPTGANSEFDVIPLPAEWDELYLLPIARKRLMASAYFKNETAKPEILDQYRVAKDALAAMRPNRARPRVTPKY